MRVDTAASRLLREAKSALSRSNGAIPSRVEALPQRESEPMFYVSLVNRSLRWFRRWVWNLRDAVPPYRVVKGTLKEKGIDPAGMPYILLNVDRIEIDMGTLDALEVGERLRVRHTRGYRAINIDRIMPPDEESA
jgi:hypothetical protein